MDLIQAKEISRLSSAPSDKCTWAPDLGFDAPCILHDHLLQHFVYFQDDLNLQQEAYLLKENLYLILIWAQSKGSYGEPFTRKDANHLFRESLTEKLNTSRGVPRKLWYWAWRNVFYISVVTWARLKRFL